MNPFGAVLNPAHPSPPQSGAQQGGPIQSSAAPVSASAPGEAPVSAPRTLSTVVPPAQQPGQAHGIGDGGAGSVSGGRAAQDEEDAARAADDRRRAEEAATRPSRANRGAVELYLEDRLRKQASELRRMTVGGSLTPQQRMAVEKLLALMPEPRPEIDDDQSAARRR
jgi:hypothetical protein